MATLLVDAPNVDARTVVPGTVIGGRYVIQREIGRGGFGCVFAARHTGTGQEIALKVISHADSIEDMLIKRFFQEARVTSGLKHPNTIRVFDFGQDDSGLIYLAMELLNGRTLKQEFKKRLAENRTFAEREAVRIGVGVARSLAEAHAAGLVHRDLKPDNIFLQEVADEEPTIKVLDFGIVKLANSNLTMGSDSGVPGTPAYMSPEQVNKEELDGRADLYSLGIILYQLLAGRVPFPGSNVVQILYNHVHEQPQNLRSLAKSPVSDRFVEIVHSLLSKDPRDRPKDARTLRRTLEGWGADQQTSDPQTRTYHSVESRPLQPPEVSVEAHVDNPTHPKVEAVDSVLAKAAKSGRGVTLAIALLVVAIVLGTLLGVMLTDEGVDGGPAQIAPLVLTPEPAPAASPVTKPETPRPPPVPVEEIQPVHEEAAIEEPAPAPGPEPVKKKSKKSGELDVLYDKI
jgi:eukaryotic-like serine/threonine-protein kinase